MGRRCRKETKGRKVDENEEGGCCGCGGEIQPVFVWLRRSASRRISSPFRASSNPPPASPAPSPLSRHHETPYTNPWFHVAMYLQSEAETQLCLRDTTVQDGPCIFTDSYLSHSSSPRSRILSFLFLPVMQPCCSSSSRPSAEGNGDELLFCSCSVVHLLPSSRFSESHERIISWEKMGA